MIDIHKILARSEDGCCGEWYLTLPINQSNSLGNKAILVIKHLNVAYSLRTFGIFLVCIAISMNSPNMYIMTN
jgi:hypothetical protein